MSDAGVDAGVSVVAAAQQAAVQAAQAAPVAQPQTLQLVWWLLFVLVLSMFFLVLFVRALPWSDKARASKPLSCDVCLTGWLAIGFGVWLAYASTPLLALLHVLPAAGLTVALLAFYGRVKIEDLRPPPL